MRVRFDEVAGTGLEDCGGEEHRMAKVSEPNRATYHLARALPLADSEQRLTRI